MESRGTRAGRTIPRRRSARVATGRTAPATRQRPRGRRDRRARGAPARLWSGGARGAEGKTCSYGSTPPRCGSTRSAPILIVQPEARSERCGEPASQRSAQTRGRRGADRGIVARPGCRPCHAPPAKPRRGGAPPRRGRLRSRAPSLTGCERASPALQAKTARGGGLRRLYTGMPRRRTRPAMMGREARAAARAPARELSGVGRGKLLPGTAAPAAAPDRSLNGHPYFWAPFIVIGAAR